MEKMQARFQHCDQRFFPHLEKVLSLLPGRHRLNLHAMYLETAGQPVERNQIELAHFQGWIDWAKDQSIGMDFNPTFFAHPKAEACRLAWRIVWRRIVRRSRSPRPDPVERGGESVAGGVV